MSAAGTDITRPRAIRCPRGTAVSYTHLLQLLEEKIKDKAEALLKSQKKFMAESFLVTRNGRLCLPVKKEYKSKIPGSTIDRSSSGSTVFIEPETIARMQDEIEGLRIEEDLSLIHI